MHQYLLSDSLCLFLHASSGLVPPFHRLLPPSLVQLTFKLLPQLYISHHVLIMVIDNIIITIYQANIGRLPQQWNSEPLLNSDTACEVTVSEVSTYPICIHLKKS